MQVHALDPANMENEIMVFIVRHLGVVSAPCGEEAKAFTVGLHERFDFRD